MESVALWIWTWGVIRLRVTDVGSLIRKEQRGLYVGIIENQECIDGGEKRQWQADEIITGR